MHRRFEGDHVDIGDMVADAVLIPSKLTAPEKCDLCQQKYESLVLVRIITTGNTLFAVCTPCVKVLHIAATDPSRPWMLV